MKNAIARFGKFLSAMVMPNIGAFIAWGFITALFIEKGWIPNANLASIQPFMLTYLLPVLIAAQGGKMVGGDRGRVMGAIAVMGCIAGVGGTDGQPMLMGAMIMGPLAGLVIKKFAQFMENRMPAQCHQSRCIYANWCRTGRPSSQINYVHARNQSRPWAWCPVGLLVLLQGPRHQGFRPRCNHYSFLVWHP